jgi:8-oxo-dGTP pyrophosphatase MutT (NUDIX family)
MEQDELPDDAAVREVFEETGIRVGLAGERREDIEDPVQLHRPPWCSSRTSGLGTSI